MQGLIEQARRPGQAEAPVEQTAPAEKPAGEPAGKQGKYRTNVVSVLPEELREPFERLVVAGMQIMFHEGTQEDIQKELARDVPMFQKLAESVAGLMGMLVQQSEGMPPDIIVPAAIELLHEAAAYVQDMKMGAVSPEELKEATQYLVVLLMKGQGAQDEQITQMMAGGQPEGGGDGSQLG